MVLISGSLELCNRLPQRGVMKKFQQSLERNDLTSGHLRTAGEIQITFGDDSQVSGPYILNKEDLALNEKNEVQIFSDESLEVVLESKTPVVERGIRKAKNGDTPDLHYCRFADGVCVLSFSPVMITDLRMP